MGKINKLLLNSGQPIPFEAAQLIITPPKVKTIAFIGEETFYSGCTLLAYGKNLIKTEDNSVINALSDFEIIMSVLMDENPDIQNFGASVQMVLELIFPNHEISILDQGIALKHDNQVGFISNMNYNDFKEILQEMFCLDYGIGGQEYNPAGKKAQEIANKLRAAKAKRQQNKMQSDEGVNILDRYVSLLAVGEHKNRQDLLDLTVYQITQEFRTYQAKEAWDSYMNALRAGADPEKLDTVHYWMDFDKQNLEDETINYV